jgi:hypothetical protein
MSARRPVARSERTGSVRGHGPQIFGAPSAHGAVGFQNSATGVDLVFWVAIRINRRMSLIDGGRNTDKLAVRRYCGAAESIRPRDRGVRWMQSV